MARTKKGRRPGQRKNKPPPKSGEWTDRNEEMDMTNTRFEAYYKAQGIVPPGEWDALTAALRAPLPSTFRISGSRQMAGVLSEVVQRTYVPELQRATFEGEPLPVPRQIPWFPGGLAWQLDVQRKSLRKSAEYKKFHSFLVYETEVGNIARQEAVSMVPPLFLDVRPHHYIECKVMDMCAAPGSKTSQLLEAMTPDDAERVLPSDAQPQLPSRGLLVANDADQRRAHLLVHTTARRALPGLLVTSVDASIFPAIFAQAETGEAAQVRFDRILADVPCSGDGTMRKNVGIWRTWSARDGTGLHGLQLRILQRAMRLLKDDSECTPSDRPRIVYSTCSLNPVENEAVIAAALNSMPGFELVDVSQELTALLRRPGLTSWRPSTDKEGSTPFATWEEYQASLPSEAEKLADLPADADDAAGDDDGQTESIKPGGKDKAKGSQAAQGQSKQRSKLFETHWPPSNVSELRLERCLRILPHLQDTGGFFVAVLQRRTSATNEVPPIGFEERSSVASTGKRQGLEENEDSIMQHTQKKAKIASTVNEAPGLASAPSNDSAMEVEAGLDGDNDGVIETSTPDAQPKAVKASGKFGKKKAISADAGGSYKENPFTFVAPDEPAVHSSLARLDLRQQFPAANLYVRNPTGAPIRSLYLVNDVVKAVMRSTPAARVRLISAGVKVFGRSDIAGTASRAGVLADDERSETGDATPSEDKESTREKGTEQQEQLPLFRILSEGLHTLLPYLRRESLLFGDAAVLRTFLQAYYPLCSSFEQPFRNDIESRGVGSHIICFKPGPYVAAELVHELYLPLWKSEYSVSLMKDKQAKSALSLTLFGEDITVAGRKAAQKLASVDSGEKDVIVTDDVDKAVDVDVESVASAEVHRQVDVDVV